MKALTVVGLVVLALGIISFFVPFPHSEHHGVRVGDAHVGITTRHDEKAPLARREHCVWLLAGAGLMIARPEGVNLNAQRTTSLWLCRRPSPDS